MATEQGMRQAREVGELMASTASMLETSILATHGGHLGVEFHLFGGRCYRFLAGTDLVLGYWDTHR
jgi:hypothetical protein